MLYIAIILGCVIGAVLGMNAPVISYTYSSYLSIAIIAALDTVFGGIASVVKGNFDLKIFLSGFFGNSILSIALTFLGNKLNLFSCNRCICWKNVYKLSDYKKILSRKMD